MSDMKHTITAEQREEYGGKERKCNIILYAEKLWMHLMYSSNVSNIEINNEYYIRLCITYYIFLYIFIEAEGKMPPKSSVNT